MAVTVAHVGRDPFARGEYHRESIGNGYCAWCGQYRRALYAYGWEPDSVRGCTARLHRRHGFCNRACFNAYHS